MNCKLMDINVVRLGWVCVSCGWARNLCYNWEEFFIKLGFNFCTSYFVLDLFMLVLLWEARLHFYNLFFKAIELKFDIHNLCAYSYYFEI